MRIIDTIDQNTDQWSQLRVGRITASRAKLIMSEPRSKEARETGKLSKQAETLMNQMLAERITGNYSAGNGMPGVRAIEHGNQWEPKARQVYEEIKGTPVKQVGFIEHDTLAAGCSPDGLIGEVGGLEIKCPYDSSVHMTTLLSQTMPTEHKPQIQFSLWISNREWWDFMSYDPRCPEPHFAAVILRQERDEEYIQTIDRRAKRFLDEMRSRWEALKMFHKSPIESEVHRIAHMCVEPITLTFNGEIIG